MTRPITKHDMIRYIAYISYDTITNLYTLWYKGTTPPRTCKYAELSKSAKEYLKNAHNYTYGASTYYRMER